MLSNLTIHSKPKCIYCERAKTLLDSLNVDYKEVVYDPVAENYGEMAADLIARTGHKTFPQIFAGADFLGGFEELKKLVYKPSFMTFKVIKRNGSLANLSFDKIVNRINLAANYPHVLKGINSVTLAQSIIGLLSDKILTQDIDDLLVSAAANKGFDEPDYLTFAGRLYVNNMHKKTLTSFKDKMELLYRNTDERGKAFPKISKSFYYFVVTHQKEIERVIDYKRDYLLDFFGLKTLEKGYLQMAGAPAKIIERPQDAIMRESIFIHYRAEAAPEEILKLIFESYEMRSNKLFTHASPTIFNAGTLQPGCISCFLADVDDSTEGIANTTRACMLISKACGGIGFSLSKLRSKNSVIKGSNGRTQGIVPFMQLFEQVGRSFNQSSKREGKIALYLDMHHPDIIPFIRTKLIAGNNQEYCKDISTALWVSDLFMKRVRDEGIWSMFNPQHYPELLECYGAQYEALYEELEAKGVYTSQIPARDIWKEICIAQGSSGMPYILFKDQINRTSNQRNVGIVRTSNLCAEIVEVSDYRDSASDEAEFACCTLASIALPEFVVKNKENSAVFDFDKLEQVMKVVVRNLNNIIEYTHYPTKEAARSNKRHRPLGIGVQGLADVFAKFKYSYESKEAEALNACIFEHMYYYALKASNELAKEQYDAAILAQKGPKEAIKSTIGAYSTFEGSPLSQGILNFDNYSAPDVPLSIPEEKWDALRQNVIKYGARNSLLLALMPTASTSNILGNTECFEPFTNNVFVRFTLSGEFLVVNKYLVADLKEMDMWTPEIIAAIKQNRGSIANIDRIPQDIKERYKTVWEVSQRAIINLAAGRQRFICQSQSMNLHFSKLSLSKFTTAMFLGWSKGLKTGVYYMRTQMSSRPDMGAVVKDTPDCCSA